MTCQLFLYDCTNVYGRNSSMGIAPDLTQVLEGIQNNGVERPIYFGYESSIYLYFVKGQINHVS